jgi:uncharacterized membrane protein
MLRQWRRLGPLRGTIGRTGGRGMNTLRLEAFSDGVLAFAFTLLVLDFRAPYSTAGLFAYLLSLWPQLLGFCISFLLIGLIWAGTRPPAVTVLNYFNDLVCFATVLSNI